ncbi:MAG: spermidine/putrescine ABC transporter substrate-binding protein [Bryobacterales bacterium]|nr:spermidine/putrescine ABC transporter substrate-binding protein [Bryobacterales bacterium]
MRRRSILLGSTALAGTAGLAACARDTRPRLNVYNWSEYIAPQTVANFEKERGVRLVLSVYESAEELLAKVFSGNSGWDVVFPSHYFLKPMRENNLLARLDHNRLPLLHHLSPAMQHPAWDADLSWGVPYMLGATGIVHQEGIPAGDGGWEMLWRPSLSGKVSMLDDPSDAIGAALLKLGYSLNSIVPAELLRAKEELVRQKRVLRAYLNSEARQQLVAGDLAASQMWTTTSLLAMADAPGLRFYYPREGYLRYCDCAAILKESARSELAHEFLNYLLRPEVAAANAVAALTTPANGTARTRLPETMRRSPVVFPDAETESRGEWVTPLPPQAQRLRDRLWTEIKAA